MQRKTILVVEDDKTIREGLVDFLQYHGFAVTVARDGPEARQLVDVRRFDMILLDLMLPGISGEQLCIQWRRQGVMTPIIMLTAKGLEHQRITGLEIGADDYITKPFSLEELLARINAVMRRTDPARSVGQAFEFGGWQIDLAGLKAVGFGRVLVLTPTEARILQYFAANPNRVISRQELYEQIWHDQMGELGTRTVDMHIANLRGKLGCDATDPMPIVTVRRAGYMYKK